MLSEKEYLIAENLAVVQEHLQNDLMDKLVFHEDNGSDEKADLVQRSDVEDFAAKKPAEDEDSISLKSASSDQCTNSVPTKGELLKQDTLVDLLPEIDDIFQSDEKSARNNKEIAFESLKNDKVSESCEYKNEIEAEVEDEVESNDFDSFSEQKASQESKTFSDGVVDSIFTYGISIKLFNLSFRSKCSIPYHN